MEKNYDGKNKKLGLFGTGIAGLLSLVAGAGCAQPPYTPVQPTQPVQQQVQKAGQPAETAGQVLAMIKYNLERLCADGKINLNKDDNNEYMSFFKLLEMYKAVDQSKLDESNKQFYGIVGKELENVLDKILENGYCTVVIAYLNRAGEKVVRGTSYELRLPGTIKSVMEKFGISLETVLEKVSYGFNKFDKKASFDEFYKHHCKIPVTPDNKAILAKLCERGLGKGDRRLTKEEIEELTDNYFKEGENGEMYQIAIGFVIGGDTGVKAKAVEKAAEQPLKEQQITQPQPEPQPVQPVQEQPGQPQPEQQPQTPQQPQQPESQEKPKKKTGLTPSQRLLGSD